MVSAGRFIILASAGVAREWPLGISRNLRHAITYNQATMSEFEFGEVVRLMEGLSTELQRLEATVDTGFQELRGEIAELRYSFDRERLRKLESNGHQKQGFTGESASPQSSIAATKKVARPRAGGPDKPGPQANSLPYKGFSPRAC
jgi:hypothetical protein